MLYNLTARQITDPAQTVFEMFNFGFEGVDLGVGALQPQVKRVVAGGQVVLYLGRLRIFVHGCRQRLQRLLNFLQSAARFTLG
jgi:hypothetical protein